MTFLYNFSDAISENNPRVIDDSRARKLASDLKRCTYYETCATYGLNVERVFQDGNVTNIVLLFLGIFLTFPRYYKVRQVLLGSVTS